MSSRTRLRAKERSDSILPRGRPRHDRGDGPGIAVFGAIFKSDPSHAKRALDDMGWEQGDSVPARDDMGWGCGK